MTTKAVSSRTSLSRRIRQFYNLLNKGAFAQCYLMIDPRVREKPTSVTLLQYENALRRFLESVGSVEVKQIRDVELHLDEPNKIYEGRPFALCKTIWADKTENCFQFTERWVCEKSIWYTRSTGLIKPTQIIPQDTQKLGISIDQPKTTSLRGDNRVIGAKHAGHLRTKTKQNSNRENTNSKPE
jgi:hypothetical protein